MKLLEVRQKYSAARRIFNSLLGVSSGDQTLNLMLDVIPEAQDGKDVPLPLFNDQKVDEKLYSHAIFHFWSVEVTSILIVN